MNYYHYTKGCHLPKIVRDGIIETSKVLIEKHEKPAVWLTKSPEWEVACNIGKVLNANDFVSGKLYPIDAINSVTVNNDYMKKEVGMCRILINETLPVISWAKFKYVSRISESTWEAIDSYSRSIGSPVDKWICSFSPIPSKYWEGIEMYVDDQWVRWDKKMPIEDFVELCLSCNGKQIQKEEMINGFPKKYAQGQLDFINRHIGELVELWEANKHKKGYIEVYVKPDYTPYDCGFKFIEKRIKKSSFKPFGESRTDTYVLVHFLWQATYTQYKMAVPYELVYSPEVEN